MTTKEQKIATLYKDLFASEGGKMVLADLMSRFDMFNPWPNPSGKSAEVAHGERNVVVHILTMCGKAKMSSDEYLAVAEYARRVNNLEDDEDDPRERMLNDES